MSTAWRLCGLFFITAITLAGSASAENARIALEGTLLRDDTDSGEQWLLRANDADYVLRFADDSVRRFVADAGLAGARVKVQGELHVHRGANDTTLTIVADTLVSPDQKAAVAVGRPLPPREERRTRATVRDDLRADEVPIETSIDERPVDQPATARARDVSGVERRQVDVLDLEPRDTRRGNIWYDRIDRRNQDVLERKEDRPDGPDVIMLPGGGAIIRNNP